ncbi:MAG: queuosine precursor transporter [Bacteroidales bacterium]|nr:queuosine precursor transporter [Bacteroidales bacterium]MCF8327571.1 queuosine precursor transporter [Bacteroidales bacterium]
MNELYWLVMLLANFALILLAYRFFGKMGLFIWVPISAIIANIQVIQGIELFGFGATLGNIVYASSFLVTDILSENYGKKEANKAIWIGFFSLISMTLLMNLALLFEPMQDEFALSTYESINNIFSFMPRIVIASFLAYLVSQKHDIWAYHMWAKKFAGKKNIWIRNNLSTMVSQLIDSLIFTFIAFYNVYEMNVLWEIVLTTYFLKWIVAAADTPFVYLASKMKTRDIVK